MSLNWRFFFHEFSQAVFLRTKCSKLFHSHISRFPLSFARCCPDTLHLRSRKLYVCSTSARVSHCTILQRILWPVRVTHFAPSVALWLKPQWILATTRTALHRPLHDGPFTMHRLYTAHWYSPSTLNSWKRMLGLLIAAPISKSRAPTLAPLPSLIQLLVSGYGWKDSLFFYVTSVRDNNFVSRAMSIMGIAFNI